MVSTTQCESVSLQEPCLVKDNDTADEDYTGEPENIPTVKGKNVPEHTGKTQMGRKVQWAGHITKDADDGLEVKHYRVRRILNGTSKPPQGSTTAVEPGHQPRSKGDPISLLYLTRLHGSKSISKRCDALDILSQRILAKSMCTMGTVQKQHASNMNAKKIASEVDKEKVLKKHQSEIILPALKEQQKNYFPEESQRLTMKSLKVKSDVNCSPKVHTLRRVGVVIAPKQIDLDVSTNYYLHNQGPVIMDKQDTAGNVPNHSNTDKCALIHTNARLDRQFPHNNKTMAKQSNSLDTIACESLEGETVSTETKIKDKPRLKWNQVMQRLKEKNMIGSSNYNNGNIWRYSVERLREVHYLN